MAKDKGTGRPWELIPEVPMVAPGRGEKARATERTATDQAVVIQAMQQKIAEQQMQIEQLLSRNERLEGVVGTGGRQIQGVWGEVVKIKQRLGMP